MRKLIIAIVIFIGYISFAQDEKSIGWYDIENTVREPAQLPSGYMLDLVYDYPEPVMYMDFTNDGEYLLAGLRSGSVFVHDWDGLTYIKRDDELIDEKACTSTYFERGNLYGTLNPGEDQFYMYRSLEENCFYTTPNTNDFTLNVVGRYEINLEENTADYITDVAQIPSLAGNHNGGTLLFDTFDNLIITTGDSANMTYAETALNLGYITQDIHDLPDGRYLAQTLLSLNGKVLRVDPITGNGIPGNPWYEQGGLTNKSKIYALGLRNPFRASDHFMSTEIFISDVGLGSWEELDLLYTSGLNFGWGRREGFDSVNFSSSVIDPDTGNTFVSQLNEPTGYEDDPDPTQRRFTIEYPQFDYGHTPQTRFINFTGGVLDPIIDPIAVGGNSIGQTLLVDNTFNGPLSGRLLFYDIYGGGDLYSVRQTFSPGPYFEDLQYLGDSNIPSILDLKQNPIDGSIYMSTIAGEIYKLSYDASLSDSDFEQNLPSITYYINTQYLDIAVPVDIYDVPGRYLMTVENSQHIYLATGVYVLKYDGGSKQIIVK